MKREGGGQSREMLALREEEKLGEGWPVRSVGKIRNYSGQRLKKYIGRFDEIVVFLMINIIIMLFIN